MMAIKAILFDFDGVILDSLDVKTQAFYDMYLPYGEEIAQKAANHHLAHGGISRFEKFRIYHRDFLGIEITQQKLDELTDEFSQRVFEKVVASPEVKGIREFLNQAKDQYKMWVITGTPTNEIVEICKATQFTQYFQDLHGSPEKKGYWTQKILSEEKFAPNEVVFIGDATTDYEAAMANQVQFILREHADNLDFFKDKEVRRIKDFVGFSTVLQSL
jgi:phosphoglycolate phosphatase-like HAD superfamily hydrolase